MNMDAVSFWGGWAMENFALSMLMLAFVFIIINLVISGRRLSYYEIIYRWVMVFAIGFTGFYHFAMQLLYPDIVIPVEQWQPNLFQYQIAIANAGFGLLAFLSFRATYGFRVAAVIGNTCWLWGTVLGLVYQMVQHGNYSAVAVGNSELWMNIMLPLLVLISISKLKPNLPSVM